ncbi:MAG: hypothetical protein MJ188_02855 [Treponema sp.]|nr:hypothetical protein [Treponema sp.]
MQRCVVCFSSKDDGAAAFDEVYQQLATAQLENQTQPILILFSSQEDSFTYAATMFKKCFPDAVSMGTTSYMNFGSKGFNKCGLSAMAIYSGIEVSAGALFEINIHPRFYKAHIIKAKNQLSSFENTCCLEFTTAFSNSEELVLDTLDDLLKNENIPVVGSSSGAAVDKNYANYVALNGEVYKNTCVFCLIHNLNGRIFFYKENIFKPTEKAFVATSVDCENRTVYEYNNQPATDIIADALGISFDELQSALALHPMGRSIDNQLYITETNKVSPKDGSISYFSRIYNLTTMYLLELEDFKTVAARTKADVGEIIKNPSFTLSINCQNRSMLFERENEFESFNNFLGDTFGNFIGVSGYGEQLFLNHLNESMVLVLFE